MKKHSILIALGVVLAVGITGLWLGGFFDREPVYQGKTVTAWARDLNSPDAVVRSNATAALQALGPESIPHLARVIGKRDPRIKGPLRTLAAKLPAWARRPLQRVFRSFNTTPDRLAAVNALSALGANAPTAPLLKALRDPEPSVAAQAGVALGRIGKPAVSGLIEALNDSNGFVRFMAGSALSSIGPEAEAAAPALVVQFTNSYAGLPVIAEHALVRIGKPALPALFAALKHPDDQVRGRAARVLGTLGPPVRDAATLPLIEAADDSRYFARQQAEEALGRLWPLSADAVPELIRALPQTNGIARLHVPRALASLGPRAAQALPALVRLLDDPDAERRGWAALAIGRIGPAANSAVPALNQRLGDHDEFVRRCAAAALKKLQSDTAVPAQTNR